MVSRMDSKKNHNFTLKIVFIFNYVATISASENWFQAYRSLENS